MHAIINVHHDDAFWLITDYEHEAEATQILTKIWSQLSERFKDYDERLVFETMNEPRVFEGENEWSGTDERREAVNLLNMAALETIRKSGGKNAEFYVNMAEKFGIPCIVWDNGGDFRLIDRDNLRQEFLEYINAIV